MDGSAFNAIFITAAFLVPGFIWSSVLSMLVPRRSTAPDHRAKEYLTLSCINYGLWSWLLFLLFRSRLHIDDPLLAGLLLFVVIFLSPIALGLLSGFMRQKNWVARFLGLFGFRTVSPTPTAWDYHFSNGQPYWVVVTLRDGSRLYGFYGLESFAGDDPQCRDLYLEAAFQPTDQGDWAPIEDSGGVWIASDQIVLLEFRKVTEVNYDRKTDYEDHSAA